MRGRQYLSHPHRSRRASTENARAPDMSIVAAFEFPGKDIAEYRDAFKV